MAQILQFTKKRSQPRENVYEFELNGRDYEIYLTQYDGWRWRSGSCWASDFRNAGGFADYAQAAQDAMRDARALIEGLQSN